MEETRVNQTNIKSEIGKMSQLMSTYPLIRFDVRFYDEVPCLRLYIFHNANSNVRGLIGMYYHDPNNVRAFVGAENNDMIVCNDQSPFETRLIRRCSSRFEYLWTKLSKEKAVIFDLDGVVIDSMPNYVRAWQGACTAFGLEISEREVYLREGEKRAETVKSIYKQCKGSEPSPDEVSEILTKLEEIYENQPKPAVVSGIPELLNRLKEKKIKLGLVTGSSAKTYEMICRIHPLFLLFDETVTGNDTLEGKPAPAPYKAARKKLKLSKDVCLVIENAPLGVQSATSAGLLCVGFLGSSPLTDNDLMSKGALRVEKTVDALRKYLLWFDTNLNLKDLLDII